MKINKIGHDNKTKIITKMKVKVKMQKRLIEALLES